MQENEMIETHLSSTIELDERGYQQLILDINEIPITEQGISYFYWPINSFEIHQVYLFLIKNTVKMIREAIAEGVPGTDLAIILYLHFLHETICVYQASLLIQRANCDGYKIFPSMRSRLI